MKKKVVDMLSDKVGVSEGNRRKILSDIFGANGLISYTDADLFKTFITRIATGVDEIADNNHFSQYVISNLRETIQSGLI